MPKSEDILGYLSSAPSCLRQDLLAVCCPVPQVTDCELLDSPVSASCLPTEVQGLHTCTDVSDFHLASGGSKFRSSIRFFTASTSPSELAHWGVHTPVHSELPTLTFHQPELGPSYLLVQFCRLFINHPTNKLAWHLFKAATLLIKKMLTPMHNNFLIS